MPERIRIALIGAGTFARDAHVPALLTLQDRFEIAAVYSRTRATAEALIASMPVKPEITTNLDELMQRRDIDALDLLLPIDLLPSAVDLALASGKHVISEKPIAPDAATGERLLSIYQNHPAQVWMVAENWRCEDSFRAAAELVARGDLGAVFAAHWALSIPLVPGSKYYLTAWRRSGTFPGGFLLDGGVHHVAVLRQILGEITRVSAFVKQMRADLPPADTLSAALEFERGMIGSYTVTYTAGAPWVNALHIVGERGALRVDRDFLETTIDGAAQRVDFPEHKSVNVEFAAFADAIQHGTRHMNSPQTALNDVAVIEALLEAARTRAAVTPRRFA
jgi:predicted dehydrogenase